MGSENRHRPSRHLAKLLDEAGALRLQRFDDMAVMNDLMAHIDRCAIFIQRPLNDIDGADNSGAKSAWLGKNDLHSLTPLTNIRQVGSTNTAPMGG